MNLENKDKPTTPNIEGQIQQPVNDPTANPKVQIRYEYIQPTEDITDRVRKSIDAWHWSNN